MLKSLLANDLAGWRILIAVEPSSLAEEFTVVANRLLHDHDFSITTNKTKRGIKDNPFQLIEHAFADGASCVLYVEEDLLLSPDATRLALWFEENYCSQWLCLNLLAGGCASAGLLSNADYPDLLFEGYTFNSIGFAIRRTEWEKYMRGAWTREPARIFKFDGALTGGWDWSIFTMLMSNPLIRTLQPVLARATHNGRLQGEYCTPEFHDTAFGRLPIYNGEGAAQTYRVLPLGLLPHVVSSHARLWFEMSRALHALHVRPVVSE
jgi:hypothetical protein